MEENLYTNVCRVCLTEKGYFQSIFVSDENSDVTIHLAEMIMAYASVQITVGDGLPEQICMPCAGKAVNSYKFIQKCEESDGVLRQHLGKSPLNKVYSIAEEQRLAEEALRDIDPYTIDVIIKPEVVNETEEADEKQDVSIAESDVTEGSQKDTDDDVQDLLVQKTASSNRSKNVQIDKKLSCEICNKKYVRLDSLLQHKQTHEVKSENVSVDKVLGQDVILDDLLVIKSEEVVDEIKCFSCSKVFHSKEELSCHVVVAHAIKPRRTGGSHHCPTCNKKFTKASHVTRHLKTHAAIKPHICKLCNKGFARAEQLANHMNAHTGIKPHVCTICQKGFNQVSNLKDHMRTHNGEKPFLCSTCGKGFNQLGNLRQHTIRHSGIKAHLCSICGNGFASKGELCAHLRKHTGARPFVCPVCNHGFTTSSSLTKHKRIHSGEKPYECEACKMRFSRSGILARHRRTHTGEKPYVCKYCSKAFSQSNDLSSHLRIHTGEKPYICDICGQAFRQSSALKTHKKTHIERPSVLDVQRSRSIVPMIHNTFLNSTLQ